MNFRFMSFRFRGVILLVLCFLICDASRPGLTSAVDSIPGVTKEMQKAGFWIEKLPLSDQVLLDKNDISGLNKQIINKLPETVYDLTDYPASLSGAELNKLLDGIPIPEEDRYLNGQKVDRDYYNKLKEQMNFANVKDVNNVLYALTVKRTNIRTFPTNDVSLSEPNDWEFDLFQETAVEPAEPVIVLHISTDGLWYFVQIYNYSGWMPASDAALADSKANWLEYVNMKRFLVVTGSKIKLSSDIYQPAISELEFGMGTKLPLVEEPDRPKTVDNQSVAGNYVVEIPVRTKDGGLKIAQALVPWVSDVSEGYLPYTRANIIKQAFKMLGERYGWGGSFNGRDCSAFVMDIYKCFGLRLPRNGDQQEKSAGKNVLFGSLDTKQRYRLIDGLFPGAVLFTPTHVMLYLGKHNGGYYIIHDVTSLGDASVKNDDGTLGRLTLNEVAVTDLSIPRRNGKLLIDSLTSAKQIEAPEEIQRVEEVKKVDIRINNSPIEFLDQKPFFDKTAKTYYVPLRLTCESVGAGVIYKEKGKICVAKKTGEEINLTINGNSISTDREGGGLKARVIEIDHRIMVPVRFICDFLGLKLSWLPGKDQDVINLTF